VELQQKMRLAEQIAALMRVENPSIAEMFEVVKLVRWTVEAIGAASSQALEPLSDLHHHPM
jgi:hypothetical protein